MKIITGSLLFLFIVANLSCADADDLSQDYAGPCDKPVVISKELYEKTDVFGYQISAATITGNCLEVEIISGGCSGDTWEVTLYDRDAIAESYPMQRDIKLSVVSSELCNAIIHKTYSFDISSLQVDDDQVILNLQGWEENLLYRY